MTWPPTTRWINRTVAGIVLATFFSDFSHELATAVLPLYLGAIGLGPAALGIVEGTSDLVYSLAKLAGGILGHHVRRKRPWAALGYLVTALATAAIGLTRAIVALAVLRSVAWIGRGVRGPLRDFLLADAVEPTHYGRAYGLERAGDMLGAVAGPLAAAALIWGGWDFQSAILWTIVPGVLAAAAMFFMTRERAAARATPPAASAHAAGAATAERPAFPRLFWWLLAGVLLFGLGDFARSFLILLAAGALERSGDAAGAAGVFSTAVLLYALHNVVSAASAYPIGHAGDRRAKLPLLVAGYALGVVTNGLLALASGQLGWLVVAIALSGVYIAVEETLEKAVAAEILPRELRSLGFGILAAVNAVGDLGSSLYVGFLLQAGRPRAAFGLAALVGAGGVIWLAWLAVFYRRRRV